MRSYCTISRSRWRELLLVGCLVWLAQTALAAPFTLDGSQEIGGLVETFSGEDLDPDLSVIPKLVQLIARGMERMRYGPVLFRALEHAPEGALAAQLAPARDQVIGFVRLILEAHRSELRVPDLDLAAFVTVSAVEGIAAAATNERFDDRLRQEIEDLLRAYLTGHAGTPS